MTENELLIISTFRYYDPPHRPLIHVPFQPHLPVDLFRFNATIDHPGDRFKHFAETSTDADHRVFITYPTIGAGLSLFGWKKWNGTPALLPNDEPQVYPGSVYWFSDDREVPEKKRLASVKTQMINHHLCQKVWNEVMILKSVHHPNIVDFYGTFVIKRNYGFDWYMICEYANAGTLRDEIERLELKLGTERLLRKYASQIGDAVRELHRIGIAHKNLSLDTVLMK